MTRGEFNTLILLVGTNPLPNFVVAEYYIKNNPSLSKIILIYSEQTRDQESTKDYAENINNVIEKRNHSIEIKLIPLSDISNAKDIERDINKKLLPLISADSIHLNYTGGTKAMGIHVYRLLKEKISNASFSYLDARTFKLIDDEKGPITSDLREVVSITLQDILELHGYERINEEPEFECKDAIKIFQELIEKDELKSYFDSYKREIFCTKEGELITKKSQIDPKLRDMKAVNPLLSIVLALPEEYRIFNPDGTFREPAKNKQLKKTIKFIDGVWLEHYIYTILKEEESFKNCDINMNCEIRSPKWSSGQKFEIDLSLVNGYQLIGLSCTTSDELRICKSKGFEILHRTRQIGGDEARAVLVTRLKSSKRDELHNELSIDTGGKKNILVLGEEDLKRERFINKLKEFID